jgi:hypothetical protein
MHHEAVEASAIGVGVVSVPEGAVLAGASFASGIRNLASHEGQIPVFPARRSLTFTRCPLGQ